MAFSLDGFKDNWISTQLNVDAIDFAQQFGEHLCDLQDGKYGKTPGFAALTTSQIRNFFGEIKRIQAKTFDKQKSAFLLIRPKLAYAEARVLQKNKNSRIKDFRKIMERAHTQVQSDIHFQNFVDFLEATLAYHKFYGGRD